MSEYMAALGPVFVGLVVGLLSWQQSRASNRRSDFTAIAERLETDVAATREELARSRAENAEQRRELATEQRQRRILTGFVLELLGWARKVEPDTSAGPVPEPPAQLDLSA
ncbi:hypothetical protein ACH4YN_38130 [Streptomyces griseofuscus]|uniref:hypothetical protein n=1 Tax=Streptomyces griseofuscus TaxID=146922 RepID=UPI00379FBF89